MKYLKISIIVMIVFMPLQQFAQSLHPSKQIKGYQSPISSLSLYHHESEISLSRNAFYLHWVNERPIPIVVCLWL